MTPLTSRTRGSGRKLDAHPARPFPERVLGSGSKPESRVKVARDEARCSQDAVRRPAVTVEDPDATADRPARRVDDDLPREVANEAHIVVPEDHLDRHPVGEERREEPEQHRAQQRRRTDDRVLDVPRDEEGLRPVLTKQAGQAILEEFRRTLWRTARTVRIAAETQVEVGHDEGAGIRMGGTSQEEGRRFRDWP